jgi:hypothetical protein
MMVAKRGKGKKVGRPRKRIEDARRNRVVIMLTDAELATLNRISKASNLPLGTVAYEIVGRTLARRKK